MTSNRVNLSYRPYSKGSPAQTNIGFGNPKRILTLQILQSECDRNLSRVSYISILHTNWVPSPKPGMRRANWLFTSLNEECEPGTTENTSLLSERDLNPKPRRPNLLAATPLYTAFPKWVITVFVHFPALSRTLLLSTE